MKKIAFGYALHGKGTPLERGRSAAQEALSHIGKAPPALALVAGIDPHAAGETLAGVREVLGDCPLMGVAGGDGAAAASDPDAGVQIVLVGSQHLQAKQSGLNTALLWSGVTAQAGR